MNTKLKTADFLSYLQSQGITLWAEDENLRFNAPKDGLTPTLRTELIARKPEILAFLRPVEAEPSLLTNWDTPDLRPSFVAPRTSTEKEIAKVWQQTLGVDSVSIYDVFFEQGGDSILATQIVSWIRQTHQVELPLRDLFARPTIAGLAENIAKAKQNGRTLQIEPLRPIRLDEKEDGCILSFAQQRSWFLDQLTPENPFYNMPQTIRFVGQLNVPALTQALNEITRRHETLRTVFIAVDGRPLSFITPHVTLELHTASVQAMPEQKRMSAAQELLVAEVQRPFDLTRGPLIRPFLIEINPQEHILLLTMHHIVSDGWSTGILLNELAALYPAFCDNKPSPLPELPIQYADFAAWQRKWLQGDRLQFHLSYWQRQLHNLPTLELPTDHPRPPIQTVEGARQWFELPSTLTEAVETLSQKENVTTFMFLLATFQTVLHRYSGQEEIVIGSPIANRNRSEIEGLIGFFANMLVLRTDFSNSPTFRELLKQVRETTLDAYEHQDLPFEKLVEELQPERDLSRTPLFQVIFAFQNAPMSALELPGLTLNSLPIDKGTAAYDFNVAMWRNNQTLKGRIEYNTDLFEDATIARFDSHFQQLLEGIVANPDTPIADLPILTPPEQQQLTAWNNTQTAYPRNRCLQNLFESQVEKTPAATAVTFAQKSYTYAELNHQANQLAHYLQDLGVGPETLVGLYVERSLEMLVGLLAVLKAGGAYLPLDPAFPMERLTYMVDDAQLSFILTQQALIDNGQLTSFNNCQPIPIDSQQETFAQYPTENPTSLTTAHNLAYTIYTSGSTGRPKGVQIEHRTVVNFLHDMHQKLGLTAKDTLLSVTTLSFDIAVLELFLPITIGAKIVLVSRTVATDGIQLLQLLTDSQTTAMQATPATWRLLLAAGWQGDKSLKILCGGEALPPTLAKELVARGS
ncbi:Polyketide synthase modules and related proteins, partial [hydrothermal vent metagenome]